MAGDPAAERRYLTVREVAAELRVSEETVRRWIRDGALAATRPGGRRAGLRIERADLEAFLAARRLEIGVRGQPLGVVFHRDHAGPVELGAPRTAVALLEERELYESLKGEQLRTPPPCVECGGATAHRARGVFRCTNPRCLATFDEVIIIGGLCEYDGDWTVPPGLRHEVWMGHVLDGTRAPRTGLLSEAKGLAQCHICDNRTMYHWTRGRQFTLIAWEGDTRRSLTRDATALIINR